MLKKNYIPVPEFVYGISNPVVPLNGEWEFSYDDKHFISCIVPMDLEAQGIKAFSPKDLDSGDFNCQDWQNGDEPYLYRKSVYISDEYKGKKLTLCLRGTVAHAKVYINGEFVASHQGGRTLWQCDITDFVLLNQVNLLKVHLSMQGGIEEVEMNAERGIIGDVFIIATEHTFIKRLIFETTENSITIDTEVDVCALEDVALTYELYDASGVDVCLEDAKSHCVKGHNEITKTFVCEGAKKWDSEHPYLYTLVIKMLSKGVEHKRVVRKIGFRTIEVIGNKMYVNGQEIKLRGVNFLAAYALTGYTVPPDVERKFLRTLKKGNVNYIRTAHYPRSEHFYNACDELGLYVECESSVVWRKEDQSNNADYLDKSIEPFAEMIEEMRNHPSIIIWSLGNESDWGDNFKKMHDYAKEIGLKRPTKVSWGHDYVDIFSKHYPSSKVEFGGRKKPTIYDEYCHLYDHQGNNTQKMMFDPGYRAYYDVQLKAFWDKIYYSDGALGGAIWNGLDGQCEAKNRFTGNGGRWGILDTWGREKPEYWCMKSVYSPIQLVSPYNQELHKGKELTLTFENRYNHTDFSELVLAWKSNNQNGLIDDMKISPSKKGDITIPYKYVSGSDEVVLKFINKATQNVEQECLININKHQDILSIDTGEMDVQETETELKVICNSDYVLLCKNEGVIKKAYLDAKEFDICGPYLNIGEESLTGWKVYSFSYVKHIERVDVFIEGEYDQGKCLLEVSILPGLKIETNYVVDFVSKQYGEIGLSYNLGDEIDTLYWEKQGLYSNNYVSHIGRNKGKAKKHCMLGRKYGEAPVFNFEQEEVDFFYYGKNDRGGRGTVDFRSSKTNVTYAYLKARDNRGVEILGDGKIMTRATLLEDKKTKVCINNEWEIPQPAPWSEEYPGNDVYKKIKINKGYNAKVSIRLSSRLGGEND